MIRITTLLWIGLLMVAGGTVMYVSYQVRHVQAHIAELSRDTRQQQDAIRILGAEWDTLNDPQRIDALAHRYLPELQPTPIGRVVQLSDIPLRPSEDQLARIAAATPPAKPGRDHAVTKKSVPELKPARPTAPIEVASRLPPRTAAPSRAPAPSPAAPVVPPSAPPAADGVGLILARVERSE
jgi:cell division protein FtsL